MAGPAIPGDELLHGAVGRHPDGQRRQPGGDRRGRGPAAASCSKPSAPARAGTPSARARPPSCAPPSRRCPPRTAPPSATSTPTLPPAAAAQLAATNSAWLQFFVSYDPVPALKALQVPVLALFGSKDLQVPVPSNSDAMPRQRCEGNADAIVEVLQDANHLFQKATTGSPNEYADAAQGVRPRLPRRARRLDPRARATARLESTTRCPRTRRCCVRGHRRPCARSTGAHR